LTKARKFLQRSWGFIAAAVGLLAGLGYLYERRRLSQKEETPAIDDKLKVIDKVEEVADEAQEDLDTNQKVHEDVVKTVEDQYQQNKKTLKEEEKKEIKQLAQDYSDNPEELAKKLSELTGFKVILPEE
jgi:outer membrane protein OmpA-like peptidoglycan-associated protein